MEFDPQAIRAFERASWERAAPRYGATFAAATAPFIETLLDAARIGAGTRVLDVACGPGHGAAAAAARGALPAGIDFSPAMLAVARAAHPKIDFAHGDAEALPHSDDSFDAVISNFGMHHFPRPAAALAQACRVLKRGGRVAFTTWARPEHNIAWGLVLDAVRRHGDIAAAKAPPPGGSISTPEDCFRVFVQAGFDQGRIELVRREWPVRSARDLIEALSQGTARMAALIAAQNPAALPAIEAELAAQAETYRARDGLRLPTAAILVSGIKT